MQLNRQMLSSWLERLPASLNAPAKQGGTQAGPGRPGTEALASLRDRERGRLTALVQNVRQQLQQLQSTPEGAADADSNIAELRLALQKNQVRSACSA